MDTASFSQVKKALDKLQQGIKRLEGEGIRVQSLKEAAAILKEVKDKLNPLPEEFRLHEALELVKSSHNCGLLVTAFLWRSTEQGEEFWDLESCKPKLSMEARLIIFEWIIFALQNPDLLGDA